MGDDRYIGTCFPAIDLSALNDRISEFVKKNIDPQDLLDDTQVTRNPIEKNPHVSIHFGLKFDNDKFERISRFTDPLKLKIQGLDKFSNYKREFNDGSLHNYDILWAHIIDNGSLLEFHKRFVNEFDKKPERDFTPHLTLVYLKYGKADRYIREWNDKFGPWELKINSFEVKNYGDRISEPIVYKLDE